VSEAGQQQTIENQEPDLSIDLRHLRDRVDALELSAAEHEKPWYKQAANLLSILAVAVSAGVVIYQTQFEARTKELEQLQQIAVDIVDTNKAFNEAALNSANGAAAGQTQSLLTTKANILLSRGIELSRTHKGQIPAEVFFILGSQASSVGRYQDAEELFKKAIASGVTSTSQIDARRGLAALYMLAGAGVGSVAEGEKLYSEAVKYVDEGKDPYTLALRGFIRLSWAQSEFAHGDANKGMQEFSDAESAYQSLPLTNPYRAPGLQNVRQMRSLLFQLSEMGHRVAMALNGEWTFAPDAHRNDSTSIGTLTVFLDPDSGALSAACSRTAGNLGGQLNMNGPVLVRDLHTALFNWQGSVRSFGPGGAPITGSTTLTLSDDGATISAVEQQPNLAPVKYTLVKIQQSPAPALTP
jgi:tetratricopeptide (TPR) repeat protein